MNKHLDLKHGPSEDVTLEEKLDNSTESSHDVDALPSARQSTRYHMNRILSNPLLAHPDQLATARFDVHNSQSRPIASVESPVVRFRQQIANGSATTTTALHCLEMMRVATASFSEKARLEASSRTKVGTLMLNWLWSTGVDTEKTLAELDLRFATLVTECLVAEGRADVVAKWLTTEMEEDVATVGDTIGARSNSDFDWKKSVLEVWVKTDLVMEKPLKFTMTEFMRIARHLNASTSCPLQTKRTLSRSGRILTEQLIKRRATQSSELYTKWIKSVVQWSARPSYYIALLKMHDTTSDVRYATEYIDQAAAKLRRSGDALSGAERKRVLHLCLESSSILFSQGTWTEGKRLLGVAKQHFGKELELRATQKEWKSRVEEEEVQRALLRFALG